MKHHTMTLDEVAQKLGPIDVVHQELEQFKRSARVFSGDAPRLIEAYPNEWVAVIDGGVVAHASSFALVMDHLDEKDLPRSEAMVRYVTDDARTMIL